MTNSKNRNAKNAADKQNLSPFLQAFVGKDKFWH